MREELGDNIKIMIDVNQGWGPDEAIKFGKAIDEYNVEFLEEPVIADDFEGYKKIANAINTPIATGENHFTYKKLGLFKKKLQTKNEKRIHRAISLVERADRTYSSF